MLRTRKSDTGLLQWRRFGWRAAFLGGWLSALAGGCLASRPPSHVVHWELNENANVAFPVVLVPGFGGYVQSNLGPLFGTIEAALRSRGFLVFSAALPPYAASPVRAGVLQAEVERILRETGAAKVHLIAYSQGGMDARILLHAYGFAPRLASVTTVATPHQGTRIASEMLEYLSFHQSQMLFRTWDTLMGGQKGGHIDALGALRWIAPSVSEDLAEVGAAGQQDLGVPVFSLAAVAGSSLDDACDDGAWGKLKARQGAQLSMIPSWWWLGGSKQNFKSNDGFVRVHDARWGHFLGCLPADHLSLLGWDGPTAPLADHAEFSPADFFMEYADRLQRLEDNADPEVLLSDPPPSYRRLRWAK